MEAESFVREEDLFPEKLFLVHPFGPPEGGGMDRRRQGRAKTANF